jgi:hypothetical protein
MPRPLRAVEGILTSRANGADIDSYNPLRNALYSGPLAQSVRAEDS